MLFQSVKSMRLFLERSLQCKEERKWESKRWQNGQNTVSDEKEAEYDGVCDVDALLRVKDLIRFPLIDGAYFAKNVVPLKGVLTEQEVIAVLCFGHYPDGGCGSFNAEPRGIAAKELRYRLRMPTESTSPHSIDSMHSSPSSCGLCSFRTCSVWSEPFQFRLCQPMSQSASFSIN